MVVGTGSGHPAQPRSESRRPLTAGSAQVSVSGEAVVSAQDSDSGLAGASAVGDSATDTRSGPSAGIPGGTTRTGTVLTGMPHMPTATTPATTPIRITAKTGRIIRPRIVQVPGRTTIRTQAT